MTDAECIERLRAIANSAGDTLTDEEAISLVISLLSEWTKTPFTIAPAKRIVPAKRGRAS